MERNVLLYSSPQLPTLLIYLSALVLSIALLKNLQYLPSSRNLPWTKTSCQTIGQSLTCLLYLRLLNASSKFVYFIICLQTTFAILTSQPIVNTTQLKQFCCTFTIISQMPSAHRNYPVSVFVTFLLHLIPSTMTI